MEEQNKINEVLLNKYNEYSKKYNDNEIEKNELSKKLDAIKMNYRIYMIKRMF